jgi:hypothetical protein
MARKAVLRTELRRSHGRGLEGLVDGMQHQEEHLTATGTAPSMSYVVAGDGTTSLASTSTDVAGRITFADTWADADTVTLTWNEAYNTAPVVVYSNATSVNGSGVNLLEIDQYHSATSGSTVVASGTCVGSLNYVVVESI